MPGPVTSTRVNGRWWLLLLLLAGSPACKHKTTEPAFQPGAGQPSPRIEIQLPDGPASTAPVESGKYVLTTSLQFVDGREHNERQACDVQVEGTRIEIRFQRASVEPLRGTLERGRLKARGREGEGSYTLEGQVTGPGRIAGKLRGAAAEAVTIRDGKWSLERAG